MYFYRRSVLGLFEQLRRILQATSNDQSSVNHEIGLRCCTKIQTMVNVFFMLCFLSITLIILYPIPVYLFTGSRTLTFPLHLPFLDPNTLEGYSGLTFMHTLWLVQSGLGLAAADVSLTVLILHIIPMVELFKTRFNELNTILELGTEAQHSEQVYGNLRNLVMMHQDICGLVFNYKFDESQCVQLVYFSYLSQLSTIYFYVFFVEVFADAMTMCLTIYCLTIVSIWLSDKSAMPIIIFSERLGASVCRICVGIRENVCLLCTWNDR